MLWEYISFAIGREMEFVLRLVISCICGGVIGFERSRRRKEAGIRTHILVALGASMMMIVSKYAFFDVLAYRDITVDASRIAANVITGISFLGAGVIFVRGVSIRGLTTAAGIWTTAGAGLAIGGGLYVVGIATTILVLAIQVIMHNVLKKWDGPVYETISVTFHGELADGLDLIKRELAIRKIMIHNIRMEKQDDQTITVTLQVSRDNDANCAELAEMLSKNPRVKGFSL
ncbi:MgtC/SapB family protein [Anaerotignum sp.]|uniref:MgtC/SapB family protein n=1 Tax=Anaerotignum sp. TaxID=2039241 RepID=UPI0027BA7717|nr:MgtC/SapB family protein [Anaerotignum sp.]MCI6057549.1 MgtC/SapB family protein [Clostridia bacterium]MDY3595917.1 MgtC/SapB family protein [Anaerotignum sp.]